MVAINTVFLSDYHWHFWARVWRTPILGEIAMAVINKMGFTQELRRGSRALPQAHIDQTWALMTPRMKKEVLRLYRPPSEKFPGVRTRFSGANQSETDTGDLG